MSESGIRPRSGKLEITRKMNRRQFTKLLAGTGAVAAFAPFSIVGAQSAKLKVGVLLPKADPQTHDAADALAIAVCHAHHRQSVLLKVAAR